MPRAATSAWARPRPSFCSSGLIAGARARSRVVSTPGSDACSTGASARVAPLPVTVTDATDTPVPVAPRCLVTVGANSLGYEKLKFVGAELATAELIDMLPSVVVAVPLTDRAEDCPLTPIDGVSPHTIEVSVAVAL